MGLKLLNAITAAGTAVTNTTTETAVASYSIPAYGAQNGKVYHWECGVRTTGQNSTDTLLVKAYLGSTAIYTSAAVDQAAGDVSIVRGVIVVRDADSSGTAVCLTTGSDPDASGSIAPKGELVLVSSLNFQAAIALSVKVTWSVAHASNSCQAELFNVYEVQA